MNSCKKKKEGKKNPSPLFIFGFIAQPAASVQDLPFLFIYFFFRLHSLYQQIKH